jgi:signal peptidase II
MSKYFWVSAVVLALDQASKYASVAFLSGRETVPIMPFFNLTLVYNSGASALIRWFVETIIGVFSEDVLFWQRWLLIVLSLVVSVLLAAWIRRLDKAEVWLATSFSLILGGALGNLIDRVLHGYVVDFIDIYYRGSGCFWVFAPWDGKCHWPAFNVADMAITVGAVLLVLEAFVYGRKRRPA